MQLYGGGALSLDSVCLRVGDWLEYVYDMGDQHFINVRVEEINEINNVLPEIGSNNPTRVQIIRTANLHHVISQYGNENEYDDYFENEDENDNDNGNHNDNVNDNDNDNDNDNGNVNDRDDNENE